jgi:hypothetical protein
MHRGVIVGPFRLMGGFFGMLAQGDPPRRFSVAEMV